MGNDIGPKGEKRVGVAGKGWPSHASRYMLEKPQEVWQFPHALLEVSFAPGTFSRKAEQACVCVCVSNTPDACWGVLLLGYQNLLTTISSIRKRMQPVKTVTV